MLQIRTKLFFIPAFFLFLFPLGAETQVQPDAVARFISGLPVDSDEVPDRLIQSSAYKNQQAFFRKRWAELEPSRLDPMRKWSSTELKGAREAAETLFYPFGGPDFLHAFTFFPDANRYIMFGLEPAGKLPGINTMSTAETKDLLHLVRHSLFAVLEWSFFRTNDMKVDLIKSRMGAAPLILAFMARSGNEVLKFDYVQLNANGDLVPAQMNGLNPAYTGIPGIRIFFRQSESDAPQEVIYFSLDVSDSAYAKNKRLHNFVKKQPSVVTYLKAASYLMHYATFDQIRSLIINESKYVLQTDSGIPVRYFKSSVWSIRLYGNYVRPIPLFRKRHQTDLRSAYVKGPRYALPYGIGYHYRKGTSNLMLAKRKD